MKSTKVCDESEATGASGFVSKSDSFKNFYIFNQRLDYSKRFY